MSQRAPGYRFQYQVPPTSSASSNSTVVKPALHNRCRRYRPANPAPTTATSTCCVVPPLVASEVDAATIASGMPHLPCILFCCRLQPRTQFVIRTISIFGSCACGDCLFENGWGALGGGVRGAP